MSPKVLYETLSAPTRPAGKPAGHSPSDDAIHIPVYLSEVYGWAYLNPRNVALLDREPVVAAILWGNNFRLKQNLLSELHPGHRVLQAAHVYGNLVPQMADRIGPDGCLDIVDVSPVQVIACERKLCDKPWAKVRPGNAADIDGGDYDVASSFFLLHELPSDYKRSVVDALLASTAPNGRAVFIDYHRMHSWHPLKGIMSLIYDRFEPFAKEMWQFEISDMATLADHFTWTKTTCFGGLYQKVVAIRKDG